MNHQSRKMQMGMTLLELLVATGILAVISTMAFMSIDNLIRSKAILDEHSNQLNQTNLAYYLMQNDLQFAVSNQQLNLQIPEFTGATQNFSLLKFTDQVARSSRIETTPQSRRQQPLQRIRWYVRDEYLVRSVQPAHSNQGQTNWQEMKLLPINSLNCRYKNQVGIETSSWPNSTAENSALPQSIQCSITSAEGLQTDLQVTPWKSIW
jgi:type II secretion system protein J